MALLVSLRLASAAAQSQQRAAGYERLRLAARAYSSRNWTTCAQQSMDAAAEQGELAPFAMLLAGQCLFYAQRHAEALKWFTSAAKVLSGTMKTMAIARTADTLAELGRYRKAARRYHRIVGDHYTEVVDTIPALWFLARRAKGTRRLDVLLKMLRADPLHPLTLQLIDELGHEHPGSKDAMRLARALHRARLWNRAEKLLLALAEKDAADSGVQLELGMLYFHWQRYDDALKWFDRLLARAASPAVLRKAWFFRSRTLGRLHRDGEAIAGHIEFSNRFARSPLADTALYYAAWLEQNRGRCTEAVKLFEQLRRRFPASRWLDDADWYTVLCALRKQRWKEALGPLQRLSRKAGEYKKARALYWLAVALEKTGDHARSAEAVAELGERFGLSWYGLCAASRWPGAFLHGMKPEKVSPAGIPSRGNLGVAIELASAGLIGWSRAVLSECPKARMPAAACGSREEFLVAAQRTGACDLAWKFSTGYVPEAAGRPTEHDWFLWRAAYPRCYGDTARRLASARGIDPLLVMAVIRTESGFSPTARSIADARGLMQLVGTVVGKQLPGSGAEKMGTELFHPEKNLALGIEYLHRLFSRWRNSVLAVAAYNAGADAVERWLKQRGQKPLDLFVELVPFNETRRYVKRVHEAWLRYAVLEGAPLPVVDPERPAAMPLERNHTD